MLTGGREPLPERSDEEELVARLELGESPGPRADFLDQELELALTYAKDAEGARQERPLALSPAPPLGRARACRTGPVGGGGRWGPGSG